jgi:ABC-type Mn2+/Zn2+ transport system ATPase subunit
MAQRIFTYYLPKSGGSEQISHETTTNSVVIIGANGSGKSRLGAWIENQNRSGIHRIGAQRSLSWKENLVPKSFERLSNIFLYGYETGNKGTVNQNRLGGKDGKTTTERNDIDAVLSAVFSKRTTHLEDLDERLKTAPNQS